MQNVCRNTLNLSKNVSKYVHISRHMCSINDKRPAALLQVHSAITILWKCAQLLKMYANL